MLRESVVDEDFIKNFDEAFIIGYLMIFSRQEEDCFCLVANNSLILHNFNFKEKIKNIYGIDCESYDGTIFFTSYDQKIINKFKNYFNFENNKLSIKDEIFNSSPEIKKAILRGMTVYSDQIINIYFGLFDSKILKPPVDSYEDYFIESIKKLIEGTDCELVFKDKNYKIINNFSFGFIINERMDKNVELTYYY